jgi:hypothetical protein
MKNLQKSPEISNYYYCEKCHYKCSKNSEWIKHELTQKHFRLTNTNIDEQKNLHFICECGKKYKHMSSLCKHKKLCKNINNNVMNNSDINDKIMLTNLVLEIIKNNNELQKQNQDFKEIIIEQTKQNQELTNKIVDICKNGTNNSITNNTTNSHNKTFNLQFFLNEECKNAMNIGEFVSSIKMDLDDLERTGLLGYSEGISNIINKNLKSLDQTMRPIHCSDVKREVFYVKNDDQWIKEKDAKPVLTKAIKQVAHENIKQISEWQKKYPDCCDPDSTKNDTYLNIVSNAMSGGTSEEQLNNYEKIISNVAKEVIIGK